MCVILVFTFTFESALTSLHLAIKKMISSESLPLQSGHQSLCIRFCESELEFQLLDNIHVLV